MKLICFGCTRLCNHKKGISLGEEQQLWTTKRKHSHYELPWLKLSAPLRRNLVCGLDRILSRPREYLLVLAVEFWQYVVSSFRENVPLKLNRLGAWGHVSWFMPWNSGSTWSHLFVKTSPWISTMSIQCLIDSKCTSLGYTEYLYLYLLLKRVKFPSKFLVRSVLCH